MVEQDFETQLERMFAQSAPMPDAEAFNQRVETKLKRSWGVRTIVIGAAGVIGGAFAVTQSLGLGLGDRLKSAGAASSGAFDSLYQKAADQGGSLLQAGSFVGMFWLVSGLMIVAAIVGATRSLDES